MSRLVGDTYDISLTTLSGAFVLNGSVGAGGALLPMTWVSSAGSSETIAVTDASKSGQSISAPGAVHACTNEANRCLVGSNGSGLTSLNFSGGSWSQGPSTFNYATTYGYTNEINGNMSVVYDYANNDTYYVGGYGGFSGYVPSLVRHNGSTDTFTTRASIPQGRGYSMCSVISSNRVISVGGVTGSPDAGFSYSSSTYIYNMSSNSWSSGASYPAGSVYGGACVWDGADYVYAMGGYTSGNTASSNVYRYTISTNSWTSITAIPFTGYCTGFRGPDGYPYVNGGSGLYKYNGSSWSLITTTGIGVATACEAGRTSSGAVYWPTFSSGTITIKGYV